MLAVYVSEPDPVPVSVACPWGERGPVAAEHFAGGASVSLGNPRGVVSALVAVAASVEVAFVTVAKRQVAAEPEDRHGLEGQQRDQEGDPAVSTAGPRLGPSQLLL